MLGNMIFELRRKNITNKAVAELIGSSEKTVVNKLNGTSEFTVSEAVAININLLPEFRLSYLCANTTDTRSPERGTYGQP